MTHGREGARALLRFSQGNAKLDANITVFSLVAGATCPFARECLSRADRRTGVIKDGREAVFRCYAASGESRLPAVRRRNWRNLELLRAAGSTEGMARLILESLSPYAGYVRVHEGGDFFGLGYLDSWLSVARQRPKTTFYWYSKSLPFWASRLGEPVRLTAYGLRYEAVPTQPHGGRERVYRLENVWVMVRRRGQHLTVTVSGSVVREWPVKVYEDGHNRRPENPVLGGPTLRQAQWKATVEFLTRMVNERHSDDAQAQTMLKAARDSGWD